MKLTLRKIALVSMVAILSCAFTKAQDYRATILGTITDPTGAAVPGARILLTNSVTGTASQSVSNSNGSFTLPFLVPGTYTMQVQKQGFATFVRRAITLQANDQQRMDIKLEVGQASTRVEVTAQTPLLDTADANNSQALSNVALENLPSQFLVPTNEIPLSPGVNWASTSRIYFRAFDTQLDYSMNGGGRAENSLEMDGLPDNSLTYYETRPSGIAYEPPLEATQETSVITNIYDAEYGRTLGGIVNLVTKSGGNALHGAAYFDFHRTYLDSNTYANNQQGAPTPPDFVNEYGFELSGPIVIPKVYHGRKRTFFMAGFEHYYQSVAQTSNGLGVLGSVPTDLQRNGDFSQTYNSSGKLITIYDPTSTQPNPNYNPSLPISATNGQYIRTAFTNNKIPTTSLNPVALKVLGDIPHGNVAGNSLTGLNNYFDGHEVTLDYYYNVLARVDHEFNDRWKMFGRWERSRLTGGISNTFDWTTPAREYNASLRWNDGAGLDVVGTLNPQTVFSARIGYHRFTYGSNFALANQQQAVAALGIPVTSQLQAPELFPLMNFTNYASTGKQQNDWSPNEDYYSAASLMKIMGRHTVKAGVEVNLERLADAGIQNSQGAYNFTVGFTQANPQVADSTSGNSIASFLLGDMASASANINAEPLVSWHYVAPYVQDDWQVNQRLTLNLGLRWDYLSPPYVRNGGQNVGFDYTDPDPIQVSGMNLRGGLLFAGVNGQPKGAWQKDFTNWQPRFGFALLAAPRLVARGGVGMSYAPINYLFGGNMGFAQTTTAATQTADFKPLNTLSNPFPSGLLQPSGSSLGLTTSIGNAISFTSPNFKNPYVWQFSLGLQYEITHTLLVSVSYVGSQTRHLEVSKAVDYLTPQQLSLGSAYLGKVVSNPFYGVLPASSSLGAAKTVTQAALLTAYPQFSSITQNNLSVGRSHYDSLQAKVEERMNDGLTVMGFYTWSKNIDANTYLNPSDLRVSRNLDTYDMTNYFTFAFTYDFPIGPGRRWVNKGIAAQVLGAWELGGSGTVQSGMPMTNPTGYFIKGNPALPKNQQSLSHWFNTSSSIWVPIPPYTLTNTPVTNSQIRLPAANQYQAELTRYIPIWEQHQLRLRMSYYNLGNTPFWGAPNTTPSSPLFGTISPPQTNLARTGEIEARYSF